MVVEGIGFGHYGNRLELFDLTSDNKKTIHNTLLENTVIRPGMVEMMSMMAIEKEERHPTGDIEEWWGKRKKEDQKLLSTIASVRMVPNLSVTELLRRLALIGINAEEQQSNILHATKSQPDHSQDQPVHNKETPVNKKEGDEGFIGPPKPPRERLFVECKDFPELEEALNDVINKHYAAFSDTKGADVGRAIGEPVTIRLLDDRPVNVRNYRSALKIRDFLYQEIETLRKGGIVELCKHSPYNSPCMLVPKKKEVDGKKAVGTGYRLVVDFRQLNQVIENVQFPMPRIQDMLAMFHGCTAFSVLDIRHAFYSIELDPKSRALTAFSMELGKWQFRYLPQGLKISPAVFQNQITNDLRDIPSANPYIDDIISGSPTPEEQLHQLDLIFARIHEKGYKLKLSKCELLRKSVDFAGHNVTGDGVKMTRDKREHVSKLIPPKTVAEVRTLLGFTSYCRAHCPYYCDIVAPIQDLVRKGDNSKTDVTNRWSTRHDTALNTIKDLLVNSTALAYPDVDKPFQLYTDASKYHMSAVLMQTDDQDRLVANGHWSKAFKGSQLNWSALVKEARAVKEAVEHFEMFILGAETVLRCDHKPLERFLHHQTKNTMVNRWSMDIMRFNIKFKWVPTDENYSDCLSRLIEGDLYRPHEAIEEDFTESSKPPQPVNKENTEETSEVLVDRQDVDRKSTGSQEETSLNEEPTDAAVCAGHASYMDVTALVEAEEDSILNQAKAMPLVKRNTSVVSIALTEDGLNIIDGAKLTTEDFKRMQGQDAYVQRIRKQINTSKDPHCTFLEKDGLMYRTYIANTEGKEHLDSLALLIPKCLVLTVLLNTHLELAHIGRDRMQETLKRRVYWKKMNKDIAEFVKGCEICRIKNLKDPLYQNISRKPPMGPMHRLAVDLWSTKHHSALTAMCLHSNYPFLIEIPDKTSKSAANALSEILATFRTPEVVLTDNGPEFVGPEFNEVLVQRGIKHEYCAPRSPQANGILERFHGFLNNCLRISIGLSNEGDWKASARAALEAYRKTPHSSTGESPLFLATGQEPCYDIDHLLPTIPKNSWQTDNNIVDLEQLKTAHALARKNAVLSRLRNKTPVHSPDSPLKAGDRVYKKNIIGNKTESRWRPGFRIQRMITNRTAIVEETKTGAKMKVNVRHLRRTDPLAELVHNSNLDVVPGRSKLYLRADELPDLNWSASEGAGPLSSPTKNAMQEIVRDRRKDRDIPAKVAESGGGDTGKPRRTLTRPARFDDYVCVVLDHSSCQTEACSTVKQTTKKLKTN